MTSINTNVSAMTALASLQQTNSMMEETQSRIATGYRVGDASDNAAYWSIATTMRSDSKALGAVEDALGLGQSKVDVAYTGLESAIDVVDEIKSKLTAAREPGVDRKKMQAEIKELQNQLTSIAESASFSGENWLSVKSDAANYNANKEVVASFTRAADGSVSVGKITIDTSKTKLFDTAADTATGGAGIIDGAYDATTGARLVDQTTAGAVRISTIDISALTDSTADLGKLDGMIKSVDSALKDMTTAGANLGAAKTRMDIQSEFVSALRDSIDQGIGTLVDADMTEESTKLKALQTQQQLGVQALSMANNSTQSLMSLFR